MKKKILFKAVPFCFGPISTSYSISQLIPRDQYEVVWIACNNAYDFLIASGCHDEIYQIQEDSIEYWGLLRELIREVDIAVVNTDPAFARYILKWNKNSLVYIDILWWMWDKSNHDIETLSRLYISETFDFIDEQNNRLGKPKNFHEVGPLVSFEKDLNHKNKGKKTLLISFGGLQSPYQSDLPLLYACKLTKCILPIVECYNFNTIYVCGGGLSLANQPKNLPKNWYWGTLGANEHRKLMSQATAILLSPGLTSFYETLQIKTPVFFIPPHNYSQILQLRIFNSLLGSNNSLTWEDLCFSKNFNMYENEEVALKKINGILVEFIHSDQHSDNMVKKLTLFLSSLELKEFVQSFIDHRKKLITRWGKNGIHSAVKKILSLDQLQ